MSRGFTLVEVVVSMLVLSGLLVAVMSAVGAAGASRAQVVERARARALADDLATEVSLRPYEDPDGDGAASIGLERGEAVARETFDDVDDYDGLSESPPVESDGSAIAGAESLSRKVQVDYVTSGSLKGSTGADAGIKRVTVRVLRRDRELARATVVRTRAWDDARASLADLLAAELDP